MDRKKVFDILNIAETRDMKVIKTAYRERLVQVNPEDDPEGFKALREAYEEAVRLRYRFFSFGDAMFIQ
jgi:curved DNA-binding protein CbpA